MNGPLETDRDSGRGLPADPLMPGLTRAWDGAEMLPLLQRGLKTVAPHSPRIERVVLDRFRYRPGVRAILLYRADCSESGSIGPSPVWITGGLYADGRARRLYRRLKTRRSHWNDPGDLPFRPLAYLDEPQMLCQVFPFDRHIPTLEPLAVGERSAMERLFRGQPWAGAPVRGIEPARYRPGVGATLRIRFDGATLFVKIYRADDGGGTHDLLSDMVDFCDRNAPGFEIVRPLAYRETLHAQVLARAPGRSLEDVLLDAHGVDGVDDTEIAFRSAARALAALHLSDIPLPRSRGRDGQLRRARGAVDFLRWGLPDDSDRLTLIGERLASRLDEGPDLPTHLDLKSDHMFVDGDRVTFIDMDSAARADPMFDVATLLVRLRATPSLLTVSEEVAGTASRAFLDEYLGLVPGSWERRLGPNVACAALKVGLFFLKHLEPDWRGHVHRLLDLAEEHLG